MAGNERRGEHQKQKLLYLAKLFTEETDAQHALGMAEIIEKLADGKQDYQLKRHQLRRIIEDMEKDAAETYNPNPDNKKSIFMQKNDTEETVNVGDVSSNETQNQQ